MTWEELCALSDSDPNMSEHRFPPESWTMEFFGLYTYDEVDRLYIDYETIGG